jgi:hypothetical protein
MPAPHPLIVEHAELVAQVRRDARTDNVAELALVQLYDALAQVPAGLPRPALRRGAQRPSVTHLLTVLGFRDPPQDWSRSVGGGGAPDFYLQRGRALHKACELDDHGRLDESTVDPAIAAHLAGWRKFKRDNDSYRSIWWERALEAPALTGRPDNLRWLRGRRALVDVKTNTVDPATLYQLALYALLLESTQALESAAVDHLQWVGLALRPHDYRIHLYTPDEQRRARHDAVALLRTYHALARCRG